MFKFFKIPLSSDDHGEPSKDMTSNHLQKYIQSQSIQTLSEIARDINSEVKQLIGMNVQALVGYLPSSEFTTNIISSKESLQNLLASAMLTGYFIHALEYRMTMDEVFYEEEKKENESPTPQAHFQKGQFLSTSELLEQIDSVYDLNIEVAIHTQLDLERVLEEFRFIQPNDINDSQSDESTRFPNNQ